MNHRRQKFPRAVGLACCAAAFLLGRPSFVAGQSEKTIPVSADVTVSLCLTDGSVNARGDERREVRAASDAANLELRQVVVATATAAASAAASSAVTQSSSSTTRVEVVVSDQRHGGGAARPRRKNGNQCFSSGDVRLTVPRGATLLVRTTSGDVTLRGVAEARVETASGRIEIGDVNRAINAQTFSGDISLEEAGGAVRLRTISGDVDVVDLRPVKTGDQVNVHTVSGDVDLRASTLPPLEVNAVSGNVSLAGALAARARYAVKSTSGDVTFTLPTSASFRYVAKAPRGDIINDFEVVKARDSSSAPADSGQQASGVAGGGDAEVSVYSFSGVIHLRRQ